MTTSERTTYFNLCVGLFNIVIGLTIELGLMLGLYFVFAKYPSLGDSISTNVLLPFVLFGGLLIAVSISVKCVTWAIKTFHLEDKLDQKVVKRYIKKEL